MGAGPPAASMSANIQNTSATTVNDGRDGWDNEDWGSLEEANEELEEKENDMNHIPASRSNSNSQSHSSTSGGIYNNNIMNNISPTKNNGESNLTTSANSNNWDNYGSSWNDDEFEPIDETGGE
jgi:hypothetical protein